MFGLGKSKKQHQAQPAGERRTEPRASGLDAKVRIDGKDYPIANLSASGFLVNSYDGQLIAKQRFQFSFFADDGVEKVDFDGQGTVVRVSNGQLAAKFRFVNPQTERRVRQLVQRNFGS